MIEFWAWSVVLQRHIVSARAFNFEDEDLDCWNKATRGVRGDAVLEELRGRRHE